MFSTCRYVTAKRWDGLLERMLEHRGTSMSKLCAYTCC